jgi:hypothetical protein
MIARMRLLIFLILSFSAAIACAQREMTTIAINYNDAQQMAAVIRPHLSAGSSVSVFQNQLVLNVTPEELAKTRELLRQLDVRGKQLLVSLRTDGIGSDSRRGVDVRGTIKSGDTVITNEPGRVSTETKTTVRVQNHRGSSTDNGNQAVRVTEGMPAFIGTGMTAPVQSVTVGPDGRRYYQQDYVNAVSGFYATTWVNDGVVRISIDQSNDRVQGRQIATQGLRSEVSGALGEWLPIGTINNSATQQTQGLGSRGQSSLTSSTQLFIKVDSLE